MAEMQAITWYAFGLLALGGDKTRVIVQRTERPHTGLHRAFGRKPHIARAAMSDLQPRDYRSIPAEWTAAQGR